METLSILERIKTNDQSVAIIYFCSEIGVINDVRYIEELSNALKTNFIVNNLHFVNVTINCSISALFPLPLTIKTLDLRRTHIRTLSSIFELLKENKTLESLYLGDNRMSEDDMSSLYSYLSTNNTIKLLDLNKTGLTDLSKLCVSLKDSTVSTLFLDQNSIEDLTPIGNLLKYNPSIGYLKMDGNNIVDVSPIFESLKKNTTLRSLYLRDNVIVDITSVGLCLSASRTLSSLCLDSNHIKSVRCMSDGLKGNTSLTYLSLFDNPIDDIRSFEQCLEINTTVTTIYADITTTNIISQLRLNHINKRNRYSSLFGMSIDRYTTDIYSQSY